jgi:hypothetical protein
MLISNSPYWNLSQVTAWVIFRDQKTVQLFSPPNEDGWASYLAYPSMWEIPKEHSDYELFKGAIDKTDTDQLELRSDLYKQMQIDASELQMSFQKALIDGHITAFGCSVAGNGKTEDIQAIEWNSLNLDPPNAYRLDQNEQKIFPWTDIHLDRQKVIGLWPAKGGMKLIPKKHGSNNWKAVERKINALKESPSSILNKSIREISKHLRKVLTNEYTNAEVPGDKSLRNYISGLRSSGIIPPKK